MDVQNPYIFHYILIQGRSDEAMWVDSYSIYYSYDDVSYTKYADENGTDVSEHFLLKIILTTVMDVPYGCLC